MAQPAHFETKPKFLQVNKRVILCMLPRCSVDIMGSRTFKQALPILYRANPSQQEPAACSLPTHGFLFFRFFSFVLHRGPGKQACTSRWTVLHVCKNTPVLQRSQQVRPLHLKQAHSNPMHTRAVTMARAHAQSHAHDTCSARSLPSGFLPCITPRQTLEPGAQAHTPCTTRVATGWVTHLQLLTSGLLFMVFFAAPTHKALLTGRASRHQAHQCVAHALTLL